MLPNRVNDVARSILAAGVAAIVATVGTFTTLNATTGILSTLKVGTSGSTMDGSYRATLSVNPASISAGGSTTTVVTVTGAVAGDHCAVNATSGDLWSTTSTAVLSCRAGTDSATVNYYNATSTAAFDAGTSVLSVKVDSY
jgi:hypothetical protein